MYKVLIICGILVVAVAAAAVLQRKPAPDSSATDKPSVIRYVALGDSYTIGQSVAEGDRWPNQLVKRLAADGQDVKIVANPSRTGYTTADVLEKELSTLDSSIELVSLQIGVNDFFQGSSAQQFEQNYRMVLTRIIAAAPDANIFAVTIPDYGKTPSGATTRDPAQIAAGVAEFNEIIKRVSAEQNVPVADVFDISQASAASKKVASDGLHPSAEQYTDWLTAIYPVTSTILN